MTGPSHLPPSGERRLLVVTHNYPRFPGDAAGAFVARLARGAADRRWTVRVVAPHAPGLPEASTDGGVRVDRFRYAPDAFEVVAYSGDLHQRALRNARVALAVPLFLARFRSAVRRVREELRPSVVHAHWWLPSAMVAVGGTAPLIVTCHGSDVRLLDRAGFRWLGRRVLKQATVVTAVSGFLAENLRRAAPAVADRVVVAPMPVETAHWTAAAGAVRPAPPIVLFAGNLLPTKGVDVLLGAGRLLVDRGVALRVRILGEGPARADLERQAIQLGLAVEFSDFVDQGAMVAEYAAAATVVLPTRSDAEGLGLVLVEGLLAGCAVVGARSGGIPDVIEDGVTGRLVPPDDAAALAAAIEDSFDPVRRAAWIAEGRRRVIARFGAENVVDSFLERYERAIERPR